MQTYYPNIRALVYFYFDIIPYLKFLNLVLLI